MSRASVLARGRRAARRGMTDACDIVRVTGTTTDPDTGVDTPTTEPIYSGPCRIQEITAAMGREATPAPTTHVVMRYRVLQVPVLGSEGIRTGDLVTITKCVHDPDLLGAHMIVRDQAAESEATARRLGVEEATG